MKSLRMICYTAKCLLPNVEVCICIYFIMRKKSEYFFIKREKELLRVRKKPEDSREGEEVKKILKETDCSGTFEGMLVL